MLRDLARRVSVRRRGKLAAGTVALLACVAGCQSLIDAPFDEAQPRLLAPECKLRKPLPPPGVAAAPGELKLTLVVSESDVAEGTAPDGTPAYRHLGYDVDDTCTGAGVAPPCLSPTWTEVDPSDGPGGIDNGG